MPSQTVYSGPFSDDDPPADLPPPHAVYRIGRGETGVMTYQPYKSFLLPHWRFKTPDKARESSTILWQMFLDYEEADDFVGMDMARKFLQMGMTRAKRYANHKGGKKYEKLKAPCWETDAPPPKRKVIEVAADDDWEGRKEKEEASRIFKEVWERAMKWAGYLAKKEEFLNSQKEWDEGKKRKEAEEQQVVVHKPKRQRRP